MSKRRPAGPIIPEGIFSLWQAQSTTGIIMSTVRESKFLVHRIKPATAFVSQPTPYAWDAHEKVHAGLADWWAALKPQCGKWALLKTLANQHFLLMSQMQHLGVVGQIVEYIASTAWNILLLYKQIVFTSMFVPGRVDQAQCGAQNRNWRIWWTKKHSKSL